MKIILLAFLIAFISGCAINKTAELYPISGPIAKSGVHMPLEATLHDVQRFSGKVDLVLYNGGVCKGKWTVVSPMESGGATILYGQSLVRRQLSWPADVNYPGRF